MYMQDCKIKTMKRLCLLLIPIFFLLFNNVNAYLVNFTNSTPQTLFDNIGNVQDQIIARYYQTTQSWYVSYMYYDYTNHGISKWTNNFAIKDIDWTNTWLPFADAVNVNWIIANTSISDNPTGIDNILMLFMDSSNTQPFVGNASLTSLIGYSITSGPYTLFRGSFAIAENGRFVWGNVSAKKFYWADYKNVRKDASIIRDLQGNGTLTIPDTIVKINMNNTYKFVYVPVISEYWLFFSDTNKVIWLSRYDSNSMSYINIHQITSSGEIPDNNYLVNPDYDAIYSEKYGYNVYLAIHEYGNSTVKILALDTVSTKQINNAVLVEQQVLNLQDYDNKILNNITTGISFRYNPDRGHFYLFYSYNNSVSNTGVLNVMEESVLCQCSAWIDTDECVGLNRKQTRTCVPSGCDVEIQYNPDATCQYTPPPIANSTKYYENSSLCINFGNTLGSTSKCEFNLEIPIQCQLNTVKVILESHIEAQDNKQCDKGNYNITICNPSFSCLSYSHPCDEFNWTHSYERLTYQPSDTALLQAIGYVPTSCGSYSCLWNGLNRWDFYASYKVECTIACYEHKTCGSGDMFGYSCTERSDCTKQDCTFCNQGCYENTGECYVAGVTETTVTGAGGISDIGSFIKGGTENAFKGSPWMLNLIALGVTGGITVSLYVGGLKSEKILIGIMLGCVLFFLSIQWLNPLIGILWALSLALLYTQMFRSKLVG